MKPFTSFAAVLFAAGALTQFIPAPADLTFATGYAGINIRYKEVPNGICEQNSSVKSYSGYADVGKDAPLTVWINGGPGSSSMIGLFQELGPCGIDINGKPFNNPYAWNEESNMLFVDEPVTVGLSYSEPINGYSYTDEGSGNEFIMSLPDDTCPEYTAGTCGTYSSPNIALTANSTQNAAPNMWKLLQGFMGVFPQYSRDGFHFTTESYGGHYGPVFNEYFEAQNSLNIPGAHNINLKSVTIGNGWYSPLVQYAAYYNFTVYPGNTYDYFPFNQSLANEMYNTLYGKGNCVDQIKQCYATGRNDVCFSADTLCAYQVEELLDIYPNRDEYDIREMNPDPFPYGFYPDYLNTPYVQQSVGAYVNYSDFSPITGYAFQDTGDDNRESGTIEAIRALLSKGITVTLYAGDADYNCNWLGGEVIAHQVGAPGFEQAGYAKLVTSDGKTHGVVKQAGKFSFTRIYDSGHEVPFYQPLSALALFKRSIEGLDIATGSMLAQTGYTTKGPKRSLYRNDPSTVQHRVIPDTWVYNTVTHRPEPPRPGDRAVKAKRDMTRRKKHERTARMRSMMRKA